MYFSHNIKKGKQDYEFVPTKWIVCVVTDYSAWQTRATAGRWKDLERSLLITSDVADPCWERCSGILVLAGICSSSSMLCVTESVIFIFLAKVGASRSHTSTHCCYCCFSGPLTPVHLPPRHVKWEDVIREIKTNSMLRHSCSCHLRAQWLLHNMASLPQLNTFPNTWARTWSSNTTLMYLEWLIPGLLCSGCNEQCECRSVFVCVRECMWKRGGLYFSQETGNQKS